MYRGMLLAVLMVAGVSMAGAQPSKNPAAEIRKNPLIFYVAYGDENACGPGCSEWIAAEGAFDPGSPARFLNFITRLGRTNLPVFFESPGGLQQQAQEIGRIMRKRGMTAGIARTLPDICANLDTRSCETAKRSEPFNKRGQKIKARWNSFGAQCSSACLYALIGARERRVPPGSNIGIHSPKGVCVSRTGVITEIKQGRCVVRPEKNKVALGQYIKQMGVDSALIEAVYSVSHEGGRYLSREEIVRFNIESTIEKSAATTEKSVVKEFPWARKPGTLPTIVKIMESTSANGLPQYSAVEAGCHYSNHSILGYFRPVSLEGPAEDVKITAIVRGRRFDFPAKGSVSRFEFIDSKGWFDRREIWIPTSLVGPDFDLKIEISDPMENSGSLVIEIPTDGFHSIWKTVTANCGRLG